LKASLFKKKTNKMGRRVAFEISRTNGLAAAFPTKLRFENGKTAKPRRQAL
jgi:hypothetical protein